MWFEKQRDSSDKLAIVQFEEPQHAAAAQRELQRLEWHLNPTKASSSTNIHSTVSQLHADLVLYLDIGKSSGVGIVTFPTYEEANCALSSSSSQSLQQTMLSIAAVPEMTLLGPKLCLELDGNRQFTGSIVGAESSTPLPLQFSIRVSKLPVNVDEVLLAKHFQRFGAVVDARIVREYVPLGRRSDYRAVGTKLLQSLIPKQHMPQETTVSSQRDRLSVRLHYSDVQQADSAEAEFKQRANANPGAYMYQGQHVCSLLELTYWLPVHRSTYDSQQAEFAKLERWCISRNVGCIRGPKAGRPSELEIRLTGRQRCFTDACRWLDRLVRVEALQHAHLPALFSTYGQQMRQQLVEQVHCDGHPTANLLLDHDAQQVHVYGSPADKTYLLKQLAALADELDSRSAHVTEMKMDLPRCKRSIYSSLAETLRKIQGVVSVQIDG